MHQGNRDWLAFLRKTYPDKFLGASVLEIASLEWNGSVRAFFRDAKRYTGVDVLPGPGVDVVSKAAETRFSPGEFDILVCLSLFEHDPAWRQSFSHNLQWLKAGGLAFICWGAEGNIKHDPEPWAIVPVADFTSAAAGWPIEIVDQFFEVDRFTKDCPGCYDVVARKRE